MKNIAFLLLISLFLACEANQDSTENTNTLSAEETESTLYQETMELHDLVMPKMATMNKLSRTLKEHQTQLTEEQEMIKSQIEEVINNLGTADEKMMDWMQNMQPLADLRASQSHEEIMSYLQKEKESMASIQKLTNESIAEAEDLIEQLTAKQ